MLKTMIADIAIRIVADFFVIPVVIIGAWAVFRLPSDVRWKRIGRGVVAGLLAFGLARLVSLLYQGQRPFEAMGVEPRAAYLPNPGFPSDHVLFVFTITFVVWACTKDRRIALVLLGLSCCIAVGRVVALVHTPLDVLGGIVCAVAAVLVVYGSGLFRTPDGKNSHI